MNDNIIDIFKNKASAIPEGVTLATTPEESVRLFHEKLDEVMDTFQELSVMEKYEILESVIQINKDVFELYTQLKKRHDFHMNNY